MGRTISPKPPPQLLWRKQSHRILNMKRWTERLQRIEKDAFAKTKKDLVLTVQPESYAETYAKENKIAYANP